MKKTMLIISVICLLISICGCGETPEFPPYEAMDEYLNEHGWDQSDLVDYLADRDALDPDRLSEHGYILKDNLEYYAEEAGYSDSSAVDLSDYIPEYHVYNLMSDLYALSEDLSEYYGDDAIFYEITDILYDYGYSG